MNHTYSGELTAIDRTSPIPAYQQIATDLAKRIARHEWSVSEKLPSENELSASYKVSRVTLRQAMAQLESSGIIEKFQGKGSFVKENPKRFVQDLTFPSLDLHTRSSVNIKSMIIEERICTAETKEITTALQVSEATPLLYFRRIHFHEERPVGLSSLWFPADLVSGLSADTLVNGSISKSLYYTYHYCVHAIDNYIESVKLDAQEAYLLNSVYDAPGLMINSRYVLENGTPVEYASTIWLSDAIRFHYLITK